MRTGTTAQVTGTQRITPYRTTLSSQTGLERACNNRDDGQGPRDVGVRRDGRAARVGTSRPRGSSGPHAALTCDSTWAGPGPSSLSGYTPLPWGQGQSSGLSSLGSSSSGSRPVVPGAQGTLLPQPLTSCLLQGSLDPCEAITLQLPKKDAFPGHDHHPDPTPLPALSSCSSGACPRAACPHH